MQATLSILFGSAKFSIKSYYNTLVNILKERKKLIDSFIKEKQIKLILIKGYVLLILHFFSLLLNLILSLPACNSFKGRISFLLFLWFIFGFVMN